MRFNIFVQTEQTNIFTKKLVIQANTGEILKESDVSENQSDSLYLEYDGLVYMSDADNNIFVTWESIVNKFKN